MKATKRHMHYLAIVLLLFFAASCSTQQQAVVEEPVVPDQETATTKNPIEKPLESLPMMYQTPAYMVDTEDEDDTILKEEETSLKVGATIKSTRGPQPLWDILKRLAALKKMTFTRQSTTYFARLTIFTRSRATRSLSITKKRDNSALPCRLSGRTTPQEWGAMF